MPRHLVRGTGGSTGHRDRAAERPRRKAAVSALSGHVDYVELAERVGQGVTVDDVTELEPSESHTHKSSDDR